MRIIVTYTIKISDSISVSPAEETLIGSEFLMSYVNGHKNKSN